MHSIRQAQIVPLAVLVSLIWLPATASGGEAARWVDPAPVPPEVQQTIREQCGRGEVVALQCVKQGTCMRFIVDVRVGRANGRGDRRYYICECGAIAQIDIRSSLNLAPAAVRRMLEDQRGRVIELIRVVSYGETFYRAVVKGRVGVRVLRITPAGDLRERQEDESDKLPKPNIA